MVQHAAQSLAGRAVMAPAAGLLGHACQGSASAELPLQQWCGRMHFHLVRVLQGSQWY